METSIELERRGLYNALRMNWLIDPSFEVEEWQVLDYRSLPEESLFSALQEGGIGVDRPGFESFSEVVGSPEELTDLLMENFEVEPSYQDQIYLIVFELWRRLIPEKLTISVFCDELDYQIMRYDAAETSETPYDLEQMEGVLSNLKMILDENIDSGIDAKEIFNTICGGCAHDVEGFLFDFISDLLDAGNDSYAAELLEDFALYFEENKWFQLLKARQLCSQDSEMGGEQLGELATKALKQQDLEYNLELLASMIHVGDCSLYAKLAKKSLPLITNEEELQDFLASCIEFYRCRDCDQEQGLLQKIFDRRADFDLDQEILPQDPDLAELKKLIN